jgi:hypothetical protein
MLGPLESVATMRHQDELRIGSLLLDSTQTHVTLIPRSVGTPVDKDQSRQGQRSLRPGDTGTNVW